MIDTWIGILLLLFTLPIVAYLTTKLAVYAFFKARHQFYEDHPNEHKEKTNGLGA